MNEEPRRQGFRPDEDTWNRRLQSVVDFVAERGHLPRQTQSLAADERRLGYWLSNQRSDLKNKLLPPERAERLDAALPQWRSGDRNGRSSARSNAPTTSLPPAGDADGHRNGAANSQVDGHPGVDGDSGIDGHLGMDGATFRADVDQGAERRRL